MRPAIRLALIGFTTFERDHLRAGLQGGSESDMVFVLAEDLASCSVAVVNADHEPSVEAVLRQRRMASAVMLGTTPRPGAAAQLPRPISMAALWRELQALVQASPAVSAAVQRVQDELARFGAAAVRSGANSAARSASITAAPSAAPSAADKPRATASPGGSPAPAPRRGRAPLDHVLVVDESDAVLRFMADHLQRFGFQLHLVREATQAIERVARHHFEWVFVASGLDGLDGFHLCKTIKRSTAARQRPPPTVVLLLDRDDAVHHLRARQAGADACLPKPLNGDALLRLLGERELQQADPQSTRAASTLL